MDDIVKNITDLKLDESEEKELNEIIADMKIGLIYRYFRVKTTSKIAIKLSYIIDTEYPIYQVSFTEPKHIYYSDNHIKIHLDKDKRVGGNFYQQYYREDYKVFTCKSPCINSYCKSKCINNVEFFEKNSRPITEKEKLELHHPETEICRFCVSVIVTIKLKTGK